MTNSYTVDLSAGIAYRDDKGALKWLTDLGDQKGSILMYKEPFLGNGDFVELEDLDVEWVKCAYYRTKDFLESKGYIVEEPSGPYTR